jgi:KaiC/GvpD/RAD55 family RecA-like ATPase
MSVETTVISHVVRHGDETLLYLIEQGITVEYFTEVRPAAAFGFLMEEWAAHNVVPSEERFARRFPTFRLGYETDPLAALVIELRAHYAQTVATEMATAIVREFEKPPHTFDLDVPLGMLAELQERVNIVRTIHETALLSERSPKYLEELFAMDGDEVPGIPTGFNTLDLASGGWQPENFVVIGAAPKRFKTAIMVWMVLAAARAGYHCKLLTFEMSIKELMDRIYCEGAQVDLTHILRGNLTKREKLRLQDFGDDMKGWGGDVDIIHDVTAATSVAGLAAQIRTSKQRPDIVFVDGMYQMVDDSREWSNEAMAMTAVSRSLKRLAAAERVPIVGTTQALLSRVSKRNGTEMNSLGYTSAWAQDANVVLGLDRADMQTNDITLRVIGARSMAGTVINVTVDLTAGMIFEGGEVSDLGGDDDTYYNG